MDKYGNIYHLKNHPNLEDFVEEKDLVIVPDEEYSEVANMSQQDKIAWYKARKDQEKLETALV